MVVIHTSLGSIRGQRQNDYDVFKGIPYAQPPLGSLRFKHAQPIDQPWSSELDATQFGAIPIQPFNTLENFFSIQHLTHSQHEDCLTLNIWRPHIKPNDNLLPVILYLYGGSFVNGHSAQYLYQGEMIVKQAPVIVVTCNYRLGALGFLDWSAIHPEWDKNNGLSDQQCALHWIHHHIAAFGGDPSRITLMGQSAGAMSVQALLQSSETSHLIHNAVMLSGILQPDTPHDGQYKAHEFQALKDALFPDIQWQDLCSEDILKLMTKHQQQYGKSKGLELLYQPILLLDKTSVYTLPTFIGVTTSEGDIYIKNEHKKLAPQQFQRITERAGLNVPNLMDIQTAQQQRDYITKHYFHEPLQKYINHLNHTQNIYTYTFSWSYPLHPDFRSAYHILDVLFWFGRLDILESHGVPITPHIQQLSQHMIADLTYFVYHSELPNKHMDYK
ncbi:carboxylesterase family protein [Staphylococcus sp. 17KM0847]|uniref:carboxylesterase family protein n=1 Tax=Staphylococcus sp. 17KM0847 TaxID=2583989 RepID=UPI0015DCED5E|nr:carboxylesterase family protein [Staphylococcus sp. 17KM0847]QLK86879.1 carboxylesterase/lipase family protein [Staphylococcus sp. 17KM0847]